MGRTEVDVERQRRKRLRNNARWLFWGRVLVELKALQAVIELFYRHRGLSDGEIFYLSVVWSIVSLASEVPSGWLADKIGRKPTLILGAAFLAASQVASLWAEGFWAFAGVLALMSLSFSCFSGTEEAMLIDSQNELGENGRATIDKKSGLVLSARIATRAFLPLIGALIAGSLGTDAPREIIEHELWRALGINIAGGIAAIAVLSRLVEPRRTPHVLAHEIGIVRTTLRVLWHDPWLLRASLNRLGVFVASLIAWRAFKLTMVDEGFAAWQLGLLVAVNALIRLPALLRPDVLKRLAGGTANAINLTNALFIAAVAAVIVSQHWLVLIAAYLAAIFMETSRTPFFAHPVNRRIHASHRSTTLSGLSFLKGLIDLPLMLLAGWLAERSLGLVFGMSVALALLVLFALRLKERDLADPAFDEPLALGTERPP